MSIRQADILAERALVRALWHEYYSWAMDEFERHYGIAAALEARIGPIEQYLDHAIDELRSCAPPRGRLLLAVDAGAVIGTACLRPVDERTAEVERMYVRPTSRRKGIGRSLLEGLVEGARGSGYERLVLDSPRCMHVAHTLYRSAGFVEVSPYPQTKIPPGFWQYWLFMERSLA